MRYLLPLILLLPLAVEAKSHRTLVVDDYTTQVWWGDTVERTVDDLNAVMPKRGPRLVYVDHPDGGCPAGKGIVVCSDTTGKSLPGVTYGYTIIVSDGSAQQQNVVCHEFMHVLTGIADNYDTRDDSCVWGRIDSPGPFDADLLKDRYPRKKH